MKKGKSASCGGGRSNSGLLPNSLRIISSCLKTVSSNASSVASTVRSAGASVASSISPEEHKEQVLWAGFDKLELSSSASKNVLLLGYANGFQVLDVDDAANVNELVSKCGGPVTFLQVQPLPAKSEGDGGFRASHPLVVVVAGDEVENSSGGQFGGPNRDNGIELQSGNCLCSPTAVRFYSLKSHTYIHSVRFRSAVYMVRCNPRIVAVGLASQIHCFDALTLQSKFSVLTYPVSQVGGQGVDGVNIGYGPMAVGPRWLAYASNNPLLANMGRLSPQNLTPSPGVSPSTSPGSGSLVARYAMESSKQLASGIITLGDMGYKKLSKYCQELIPDGSSSPVSPNSSSKFCRPGSTSHPAESDNAGVVVVKDFVSRAVISQFRAHSSQISALCFDPSGTLLVTASVRGNSINIFRIMPSCVQNGPGTSNHDWNSSHVHLYKLHRGITPAVIQGICFSHFSQWVAIVSAKGTCHIYLLSPFGGDTSIQTQNTHSDSPTLLPGLSLPWWSTTSHMVSQQSCPPPPPPPVTLSVVSRIKNGNWLNSFSTAAAYATGKASVPNGVFAAVFYNCLSQSLPSIPPKANSLEHLLVYTPTGHLVQHELLLSLGIETSDNVSRTGSSSLVQAPDEESRVKVEPVQWWYVCRQSQWPEREECVSKLALDKQDGDTNCEDNAEKYPTEFGKNVGQGSEKYYERPHWYLSNAEVQISSGRMPIWQKSKISFHVIAPRANERMLNNNCDGGEFEIERVSAHEVEVKRKDLLPVFDHVHSIKSDWDDRGFVGGRSPNTFSYGPSRNKDLKEETMSWQSKPTSLGSVDGSDAGSSRASGSLLDMDPINCYTHANQRDDVSSLMQHSDRDNSLVDTNCVTSALSSLMSNSVPAMKSSAADKALFSNSSEMGNASSGCSSSSLLNTESLDVGKYFQEGYCKVSEPDVESSSSQCEKEKLEEEEDDEESDDMLGGVFAFSEEG